MTLVDRISLQFSMQDEGFARGLYMGWDEFCRRSVTDVLDEFFARYDSNEAYIEMDRLDLDLGGIQQEEFYELFPVRLREALERVFILKLNGTGIAASSMRVPQKLRPGQKCSAGFEVGLQIRLNGLLERLGVQQPADCKSTGTVRDRRNSCGLPELLEHPLYALEKRFENLLHYLEYGFCLAQWESVGFDLYEELQRFRDTKHSERLLTLAVSKPYVMERLILQTEPARLPEVLPFATWLKTEALGHYEKQQFLSTVLELAPQSLIRFIHETKGDSSVEGMSELLENPHIRRIMKAETENHAEIDVPEYWYRLYGWLLEYYPFNGVPMFGDKQHFKLHLGRKLISFIQKREQQSYLSKADLTLQFLLEVFGADYYLAVLNIIYHNQPLNPDGSPATGDSYAWELYYILLQLSLLRIERNTSGNIGGVKSSLHGTERGENGRTYVQPANEEAVEASLYGDASMVMSAHPDLFGKWLESANHPVYAKQAALLKLAQDKPELLVQWLKSGPEKRYLSLLATLTDKPILLKLAGYVSLQLAETLSVLLNALEKASVSVSWLRNVGEDRLAEALNIVVWQGISAGTLSSTESASVQLTQIAGLLYEEITDQKVPDVGGMHSKSYKTSGVSEPFPTAGGIYSGTLKSAGGFEFFPVEDESIPTPIREFLAFIAADFQIIADGDKNNQQDIQYRKINSGKNIPSTENIDSLKTVLSDAAIPKLAKRMLLLQWFDAYKDRERELLSALQSETLLEAAVSVLDDAALRQIAIRLAVQNSGITNPPISETAMRFVGLLAEHIEEISNIVSRPAETLWLSLFLSLASWNASINLMSASGDLTSSDIDYSGITSCDIDYTIRLLSAIAGNDNSKILAVVDSLTGKLLLPYIAATNTTEHHDLYEGKVSPVIDKVIPSMDGGALLSLLIQVQRHIGVSKPIAESLLNESQTAFTQNLNDTVGLIAWLRNEAFSSAQKREVFRRYMSDSPAEAARLLRETIASDERAAELWSEIIDREVMQHLLGQTNPALTDELGTGVPSLKDLADEFSPESLTATDPGTAALSLENLNAGRGGKLFDRWTEWLLSPSVSDTEKSQMLRHYARWQPELLWKFVRYSAAGDSHKRSIPSDRWNTWLGTADWLEMVSGVSISLSETLRGTVGAVSGKYGLSETILAETMVQFIAAHPADRIYYGDASIVVKEYLAIATSLAWKDGIPGAAQKQLAAVTGDILIEQGKAKKTLGSDESERPASVTGGDWSEQVETLETSRSDEREAALGTLVMEVESELHIADAEQALEDAVQPEYIEVPNAGLCLLALWLPRLFDMLGLLTEDKKALKATEARVRAIFILQRLVTDEPREYKEQELAFNRLLTACPFHVPLPKTLELTATETQTVASMLAGVKSNWSKMANTSVKGIQRSFIERPGKLEQREDKWMLYVEPRAYDILLNSLPWSYRQIRLPWLKKKINVVWRDKEEFDFENI